MSMCMHWTGANENKGRIVFALEPLANKEDITMHCVPETVVKRCYECYFAEIVKITIHRKYKIIKL